MSQAQSRLQIIIEWLQKGAGLPKAAQAQVVGLGRGVQATLTPVTGINAAMFHLQKSVKNLGFSLGWFGYRLSVFGRIILRSALGPVKELQQHLQNWDKTMEDVALALGSQEAGLVETAMTSDELRNTMQALPQAGLEFQGVMGGLAAVMAEIAIRAGPALERLFTAIAELMRGIGGEIIVSMIEGLANAVEFVTALAKHFTWLGPIIGRVAAVLVVLAPLFILLGSALFFLGPLFIAAQAGFLGVMVTIVAVTAAVAALLVYWKDLVNAIKGGWEWLQKALGLQPGGMGASATNVPGGMTRETTINQNISVGGISGDIDLARAGDVIGERTDEAINKGNWN